MSGAPAEKLNSMRPSEKAKVLERAERSKGRKAPGLQSTHLHLHIYTHTSSISYTLHVASAGVSTARCKGY